MMKIHDRKNRPFAAFLCTAFLLVALAGCGGGGGGSSSQPAIGPASKEQLLRSVEATIHALEQETARAKALEKLSAANQLALMPVRDDILLIPAGARKKCMTVETRNETTLLRFDGTAQCNGFSGRLEVTPISGNAPGQGVYRNDIKLVDFSTGDGCPVTGEAVSRIVVKGGRFTDDTTYTNVDVCGDQYTGQVVFSGDVWETTQSELDAQTYEYDKDTKAQVDVVWQIDASTLNGKALATVDGLALTDLVDRITFDGICNLPAGGTLTIDDPDAATTVVDFMNVSCEEPQAAVTYQGTLEQWTLTAERDPQEKEDPVVAGVQIIGEEEIVFDWTTDRCNTEDIPDSLACAFTDSDQNIQLISTHFNNRRMIGGNLDSVEKDCEVIMYSDFDPDPAMYNEHEWIAATYTSDGQTIYALVHNEYYGWKIAEQEGYESQCPSGEKSKCWHNSITLAKSTDGGKTYTHARAPDHLVATVPYRYIPDNSPTGFLGLSNIFFNDRDRWFYFFFRIEAYEAQKKGVGVMRTKNLADARSWRAWDGDGYNIRFINPYRDKDADPSDHVCKPISYENINTTSGQVTYNTYFKMYLLVGAGQRWDPERQEAVSGLYFSLSDDLINWSPLELIMEAELWFTAGKESDRLGYPSLIDPEDTSRNFVTTGQKPYLYFIKRYANLENIHEMNYNRDLLRVQLEFSKD